MVLKIGMWREEDFMRRSGNDFWVIPRKFHDENSQNCRIAAAEINCKSAAGQREENFKCPTP
ncbi:hypothetical protein [Bradyrhizobium sp. RD5-C2]|uniref:hypothetical protein n=1 Tax=Bradyrhizobium sp. RD5-C2 TaxID=244562 RepID=UPI001CC773A0|nr:hypothetical protein [Bradyrhizobium sp. RD5-C2]